jgi:hypothetical protein
MGILFVCLFLKEEKRMFKNNKMTKKMRGVVKADERQR